MHACVEQPHPPPRPRSRGEMDGASHRAVASGYLFKLARGGTLLARWHRRYYVLYSDGLLHSYKSVRAGSPHRTIPVGRQCLRTRFGEETAREECGQWPRHIPARLRFSVVNSDRAFHFVCESERELGLWRDNLEETLRRLGPARHDSVGGNVEGKATVCTRSGATQPEEVITTAIQPGEVITSSIAVTGGGAESEQGDEALGERAALGERTGERVYTPTGPEVGVAVDPEVQAFLQSELWVEEEVGMTEGWGVGVAGGCEVDRMIESTFNDVTSPVVTMATVPMSNLAITMTTRPTVAAAKVAAAPHAVAVTEVALLLPSHPHPLLLLTPSPPHPLTLSLVTPSAHPGLHSGADFCPCSINFSFAFLTLPRSLTHSLTLSHSPSLSHTLPQSHTHSLTLSHTLPHSLTHSHSLTYSLNLTHTPSLSDTLSLSHTLPQSHTHTLTLSHTPSISHTLPHSLTHFLTLSHAFTLAE